MLLLIILAALLWAYAAIALGLVAGRTRYSDEPRTPLNDVLLTALVILVLCPLLVWACHIDWYGESEG